MCCLEIKKFGIIHANLNDETESRDDFFFLENKIMIVTEGTMKASEIIVSLKHLINFNVSMFNVLCFSKGVLVIF